jgi:putative transposase
VIAQEEKSGAWPVALMCRLLAVSRSGYHAWRCRRESTRDQANRVLLVAIQAVFAASDQVYGSPRVRAELVKQGHRCGAHRVARLMRAAGLQACPPRPYKRTTDSDHPGPVAPNCLRAGVTLTGADDVWVTDITYIATGEGWLYLSAVMDLYSRRIVGWAVSARLSRQLALDALTMAVAQRHPLPGLIHHSDRGSQYASGDYRKALAAHAMIPSMSGVGNCYDNAAMESFFHTLKVERVYRRHYQTRAEAFRDLFEYIEMFYNRRRSHSSLGYLSPAAYEEMASAA